MEAEILVQMECNIDDATPETLAYTAQRLLKMGALDVWMTPIVMKKGRPGVLLSVLTHPGLAKSLTELLFRETTTLGVRQFQVERAVIPRQVMAVKTAYGSLKVKIACMDDRIVTVMPEYESCKAAAERYKVPLKQVYGAVHEASRRIGDECP